MSPTIPVADQLPLPGPVWLFYALLLFLFTLHVLPMSITLGGGFYATLGAYLARSRPGYRGVVDALAGSLPIFTAATVTTGVGALLFLQVLYGNLFYSAAVIIAWPWLAVVALVILAYYGYYLHSLKGGSEPRIAHLAGGLAWVLFVVVAFIFTNEMTLMLDPARMHALYAVDPSGRNLNLDEPTLWPRYLHMVVGAVALAGLWVAMLGALALRRGEEAWGRAGLRLGSRGFIGATVLEILLGLFFLHTLPNRMGMRFMGGDGLATAYLVSTLVLTIGAVVVMARAPKAARPIATVVVGALHVLAVVVLMVLMRDQVRRAVLGQIVDFQTVREEPMWGIVALFAVLLGVGLVTVAWMVRRVLAAARAR
jgi:hypothetical protein